MKPFMGVLVALAVEFLMLALWNAKPRRFSDERLTRKTAGEYAEKARQVRKAGPTGPALLQRLEAQARKVGLRISGQSFVLLVLCVCSTLFGIGFSVTRNPLISGVLALLGLWAPSLVIRIQAERRYRDFLRKFDSALLLAASSLRAGSSVQQAFEELAEKSEPVIAEEFTRVVHSTRLGATPGDALKVLQERVPGPEIQMFVLATQSLMATGGNLADVYTQMAAMIVEAKEFREAMRAATAEGRLSAWVITLMPVVLLAFVLAANPGYFSPFMRTATGRVVLLTCLGAQVVGWAIIRRVMEVQVD